MESKERYAELCRLCASYDAIKMDIFGKEGQNRQLVDKIQTCLPFKVNPRTCSLTPTPSRPGPGSALRDRYSIFSTVIISLNSVCRSLYSGWRRGVFRHDLVASAQRFSPSLYVSTSTRLESGCWATFCAFQPNV